MVALERLRLAAAGRDDLAVKVEWVAETVGDGLGFDVLSFDDADDAERLIEVKTTGLGKSFPFLVAATEVRCSEDMARQFQPEARPQRPAEDVAAQLASGWSRHCSGRPPDPLPPGRTSAGLAVGQLVLTVLPAPASPTPGNYR